MKRTCWNCGKHVPIGAMRTKDGELFDSLKCMITYLKFRKKLPKVNQDGRRISKKRTVFRLDDIRISKRRER